MNDDRQKASVRIRLFGNFGAWLGDHAVSDENWHTEANKTLVDLFPRNWSKKLC